jgi:hypothetical protein
MFRPTPQKMAGLCYVTPVTGHKAYTGKEEEEVHLLLKYFESVSKIFGKNSNCSWWCSINHVTFSPFC